VSDEAKSDTPIKMNLFYQPLKLRNPVVKSPRPGLLFIAMVCLIAAVFPGNSMGQDFNQAEAFYELNQLNAARPIYLAIWQADPTHVVALRRYAVCAIGTGKAYDASGPASTLYSRTGLLTDKALMAKCYLFAGKLDAARRVADELLAGESLWSDADRRAILPLIDGILTRTFNIRFQFDAALVEGQTSNESLQVPIPVATNPVQQVLSIEAMIDSNWMSLPTATVDDQRFGVMDWEDTPVWIGTSVDLFPADLSAQATQSPWGYPPELARFVQPSYFVDSSQRDVRSRAASLRKQSAYNTVNSVLSWCSANIDYIPPNPAAYGGKASEVIARRYDHCEGRIMAAAALLRANGIPARMLRGHSAFVGDSGKGFHHTILEFYLASVGWVPWDYGQKPCVAPGDFLTLFSYPHPPFSPESDTRLQTLMMFQRTSLTCDYVDFEVISRR
jgi:Transglutaminase-like superfamily